MLKIPEPQKTTVLKVILAASTKKEFDAYVAYLKSKQPHANVHAVVEAMIHKLIPRSGREAKAYGEFKKTSAQEAV